MNEAPSDTGIGHCPPPAVIVSDVHLGSKHCRLTAFLRFLETLPPEAALILNGDIVDRWRSGDDRSGASGLDALKKQSHRRRVIWVRGNHDATFEMDDPAGIAFVGEWAVGRRLLVAHGHDFDTVMPYHRTFVRLFRKLHHLRIRLGAPAVHVAYYAKRYKPLYAVLRKHVRMNATEYAREKGFAAIACGHTHFAEDTVCRGVRYINTASWTEDPPRALYVDAEGFRLAAIPDPETGRGGGGNES